MKCPYCGEEMIKGIIPGDRYSLKWIPDEKFLGGIFQWFQKGIKLSDALLEHGVVAWYCDDCEKIVIDVEGQREKLRA